MAVVEKKPEARTASAFDRLSVASLAGVVFVLGSLAVAFKAVPAACTLVGLTTESFGGMLLVGFLAVVTLLVLVFVGIRILGGAESRPGIRAGIFMGLVFLLLWALLSRWIGGIAEGSTYDGWLSGAGPTVGAIITAIISAALGYWLLRIFLRPTFEQRILRIESAGWFTAKTYKPGQGVRVRRGTILGVLLMAGSGIWVLLNHGTLERGPADWALSVPFTGKIAVDDVGDAAKVKDPEAKDDEPLLPAKSPGALRILNAGAARDELVERSTLDRDAVWKIVAPLAEKKQQKLEEVIKRLTNRGPDEELSRKLEECNELILELKARAELTTQLQEPLKLLQKWIELNGAINNVMNRARLEDLRGEIKVLKENLDKKGDRERTDLKKREGDLKKLEDELKKKQEERSRLENSLEAEWKKRNEVAIALEVKEDLLKKLKESDTALKKLQEREATSQKLIEQASPADRLEEERHIRTWIEQLKLFAPALTSGDKDDRVFLLQREIDRFVTAEQDRERERRKADQEAEKRKSLVREMDWIATWARTDPLPVAARVLDRYQVRRISNLLDARQYRVVANAEFFDDQTLDEKYRFKEDDRVDRGTFSEAVQKLKEAKLGRRPGDKSSQDAWDTKAQKIETDARKAAPEAKPLKGTPYYASLTLLPSVKYTVPLILLALTIWLAWRIVNVPAFADFLIATEAEMNKVSWTTRHRLYQDTIVVLVTMVLMAVFLFVVDIAWAKLLSSRPIGVLQVKEKPKQEKDEKNLKW